MKNESEIGMKFFAASPHLNCLDDPEQISHQLYSLEILLNGAFRLEQKDASKRRIEFTCIKPANGNIPQVVVKFIYNIPFDLNAKIGAFQRDYPTADDSFVSFLLSISKMEHNLRQILFFTDLISTNSYLETIATGRNLYKTQEPIKLYAKFNDIPLDSLFDKDKLNEFTAACNNMSILGLNARHGAAANPPPKRATSNIDEAIELISNMAHEFCVSYIALKYPHIRQCDWVRYAPKSGANNATVDELFG